MFVKLTLLTPENRERYEHIENVVTLMENEAGGVNIRYSVMKKSGAIFIEKNFSKKEILRIQIDLYGHIN